MSDKVCLSVYEGDRLTKVVMASRGDTFIGRELSNALPNEPFLRVDATMGTSPKYMIINVSKKLKYKYIISKGKGDYQQSGYLAPNNKLDFDVNFQLVFFEDNVGHEAVRIVPLSYNPVFEKDSSDTEEKGDEELLIDAASKSKQLISEAMARSSSIIAEAEQKSKITLADAVAKAKELSERANSEYESIINRAKEEAKGINPNGSGEPAPAPEPVSTPASTASAPVTAQGKAEFESLVNAFKNEESLADENKELVKLYESSRAIIDETAKELRLQLTDTLKAVDTLQNELWNKPFGELAQRVREIDRFMQKTLSLAYADEQVRQVYAAMLSIRKRLVKTLNSLGIEEFIPTEGDVFDPLLHDDFDEESEGLDMLVLRCVESGFKTESGVLIKAIVETTK